MPPPTDPRIDAYIARSAEFARPILEHLRAVVHEACPDVEETMKWSVPHFTHHGMLCAMSSFKAHCAFGFWRGAEVLGAGGVVEDGAGQFGRITDVRDLPPKRVLKGYVKRAMELNERGSRPAVRRKPARPVPSVPGDLEAALERAEVRTSFDAMSPSHRREYLEWILEAKREETRARRVAQTVEWIADGKSRHWQHERR
jgi:uncharacterized protein YdeI (YjbR/CyaY-like superfamily)